MIYLKLTDGRHLLILEPANLARLQGGEPITSPTHEVMVAYTPDILWLQDKLVQCDFEITPKQLDKLLAQGLKREPVLRASAEDEVKLFDSTKKGN
jgi:hypothetical protein